MHPPDDDVSLHHRLLAHQRHLARHARRTGMDEDLASEAVTRALARPAPDGRHEAWLEGIFRHLRADEARRNARTGRALATLAACPPAPAPSPEDEALVAERLHQLRQALPALPPEVQALLHERYWQAQDDASLARARGVTSTTVRTRVHRALVHLRALLAHLRGLLPLWWCGPQPAALVLVPLALTAVLATGENQPLDPTPARPARALPAPKPAPASPRPAPPAALTPARPVPPPPPARARAEEAARPAPPAAVARFQFDDDEVAGDLQRPDDVLLVGPPRRTPGASLLEIPSSFTAATAKMIEDL